MSDVVTKDAERRRRKRRRNAALIVLSPILVPLAPAIVPAYLYRRHLRARQERSTPFTGGRPPVRLGRLAGRRADAPFPEIDADAERRMAALPDTFALCRVIGNDLVPRHRAGQSAANLRFILEHEPALPDCRKLWLLNRIFDPQVETELIALLQAHGQTYTRIPYEQDALMSAGYDFSTFRAPGDFALREMHGDDSEIWIKAATQAHRAKNAYVMNNNGARNAALEMGVASAKWALPFDGNCFFTAEAWHQVRAAVIAGRDNRYFSVPMARMTSNEALLGAGYCPGAHEEPQILFRRDAPLRFDEAHPYGRRPKVELLLHLGVEGDWQTYPCEDFDTPPRKVSPEAHRVGHAGWVARLFSGEAHLETGFKARGLSRNEAILATIGLLEKRSIAEALGTGEPRVFDTDAIARCAADPANTDRAAILRLANDALHRGPHSPTHKPVPGPSGDPQDYFHPAPYWWPDPKRRDGLPYIRRDGERVPGTALYDPESHRYDRSRLQRLFDDTTGLALAYRITGEQCFCDHAERLIRTWFVDPATRMTPHLTYAQVRMGHDSDRGAATGLIETKDFYFFLDALALLARSDLTRAIRPWFEQFAHWFRTSDQSLGERLAPNNHGTCYDLQDAALAAFLGQGERLREIDLRAQSRLIGTITPDGEQPHELKRTLTQHYCAFNLQSWVNLFAVLQGAGLRPWRSDAGARLRTAIRAFLEASRTAWPHPQIAPFDTARLVPLAAAIGEDETPCAGPTTFDPHDGIAPFWRLMLRAEGL